MTGKLYQMIEGVDLQEVDQVADKERWVEIRRNGIGGSDAGVLMGGNKYSTPLALYLAKKGHDPFNGNASTEWGHILEDPIRQKTAESLGVRIETVPGTMRSRENPFMQANLDGLVWAESPVTIGLDTVEGLGGHEIKTSAKGDGWGPSEIPDGYYWQVQHYMAVTGLSWFLLTCFILSTKTAEHYIVMRNEDDIGRLVAAEREFWEVHVEADNPPEAEGGRKEEECLKSCGYPEEVELGDDTVDCLEELGRVRQEIKELEERESRLKNKVMLAMVSRLYDGQAEKCIARAGGWRVSCNMVSRLTVDRQKLKKDGLLDKYGKTVTCRELRVTKER